MKVWKTCRCGRIIADRGSGSRPRSRCPDCEREHSRIKHERQRRDGRARAAWQRTRAAVITRDGGICQVCGEPANPPTVHSLAGGFHTDDPNLYLLLCLGCHGSVDARKTARANAQTRLENRSNKPFLGCAP